MLYQGFLVLMGVGGLFIILGLAAVIWGKSEEKDYYDALSTRAGDVREFLAHWPPRLEPGALKIGGWIAIAIGVLLLIVGGALWLWG
mgnify:CR=1 FL=1